MSILSITKKNVFFFFIIVTVSAVETVARGLARETEPGKQRHGHRGAVVHTACIVAALASEVSTTADFGRNQMVVVYMADTGRSGMEAEARPFFSDVRHHARNFDLTARGHIDTEHWQGIRSACRKRRDLKCYNYSRVWCLESESEDLNIARTMGASTPVAARRTFIFDGTQPPVIKHTIYKYRRRRNYSHPGGYRRSGTRAAHEVYSVARVTADGIRNGNTRWLGTCSECCGSGRYTNHDKIDLANDSVALAT
ncbi:hypothetical protein GGX14DRAFT_542858 [Mycena pura]|uniref:Secreted protein n=1 Tax=Mycena pura TaxID=153505 RepID=A0AAD6VFN2_9AGAR|nr:hypothetical protein GGX14DRAFT_542858 [Mycena pura]